MHQGSEIFSIRSRGRQCTCMALAAAITASLKIPSTWMTKAIDSILLEGDALYKSVRGSHQFLMIKELPRVINIRGHLFQANYHESLCGTFGRSITEAPFYKLEEAIKGAETVSNNMFILSGSAEVSFATLLLKVNDSEYYSFDSHGRNAMGLSQENGKECLMRLASREDSTAFLRNLAHSIGLPRNDTFEVVPVTISTQMSDYFQQQRYYQELKKANETELDKLKKHVYNRKYLSKEINKQKISEREKIQRAQKEVKCARAEREKLQRSSEDIRRARRERETAPRGEEAVKKARAAREKIQKNEEDVKQARAQREKNQRNQQKVKQARAEREKNQRSHEHVKKACAERERVQHNQEEVKRARAERETIQRSEENVKTARAERQSNAAKKI